MEDTESPDVWPQLEQKTQKNPSADIYQTSEKRREKKVNDTNTLVHQKVAFPRGDSSLDKKSQIGSWWVTHGGK